MTTYVKMLEHDGKSPFQGYVWPLPAQNEAGEWTPGEWVEADTSRELVHCGNGLHAWTEAQVKKHLRHDHAFWVIEYAEPPRDWGDKVSGYRARLVEPYPVPAWLAAVQPAIDALNAIPWFQPDGNTDPTWQLFPTRDAVRDAAGDAAGVAAWDAAGDAAWDAVRDAVRDAARAAVRDAAGDAARAAAGDAVRDAARAAVRDAARAAVRDAAGDAARDAACVAAWDAAGDAAGDAALYVLMTSICADLPISQKHRDHAEARMNVWRKGYGLLCDVDGVLYVYEDAS